MKNPEKVGRMASLSTLSMSGAGNAQDGPGKLQEPLD